MLGICSEDIQKLWMMDYVYNTTLNYDLYHTRMPTQSRKSPSFYAEQAQLQKT